MGIETKLQRWIEDTEALELDLLRSPPLDEALVDAAIVALNRDAHLRLVVDIHALGETRLRVRVVDRRGGWWLLDSAARVAPAAKHRVERLDTGSAPG